MGARMLTILADDLTGAADCGLQAARRGLRTVVALTAATHDAEVVARDLDTRGGDAGRAYAATRAALPERGELYLKIDSTLRGHVGAAIDAALDAGAGDVAVVAPAFPAQGRTVTGGRLFAGGEEVADLAALLRAQSRHAARPGAVIAADAASDADLRRVVAERRADGARVVWVGSAGLAAALVDALAPGGAPGSLPVAAGPVLTVVGSAAAPAAAQLAALLARPGVEAVGASAAALRRALLAGADPVVHAAPPDGDLRPEVARALAAAVAEGCAGDPPAGLVLTGGETARAVCEALGIEAVALAGEVEPGVPAGRAVGHPAAIVTKAGAFGDARSLVRAHAALSARRPCPAR